MTPTKRCDLCDAVLEFEQDGVRLALTAHTPELCRLATKQRIAELEQALKAKDESWLQAARFVVMHADHALREAGLPTLTERADEAHLGAMRMIAGLPPFGGMPS